MPLLGEMNQRELEIQELPFPRGVLESPQVETVRKAYKALGKDPARYRGSAEALLRRIVAGKGFPQINAVVDVINLVSVESRLPVGLYDLAHVTGEIVFRAGRAGETYKGIGKYDLNLEGLPVFADNAGPHGSATSDSERTMVTEATKQILAVIISLAGRKGSSAGRSACPRCSRSMPRRKKWKLKLSSKVSALVCCAAAQRSFSSFSECILKLRRASGLLGARFLSVCLNQTLGRRRSEPVRAKEVTDGLQSRSVETRSAVCAAR